jgi:hypothetical protein
MAQVQLTTDTKNFKGYTTTTSSSLVQRTATATKPADGTGSTVLGANLNYMKFKFYMATNSAPTIYVYGWSFSSEAMIWEPQLLVAASTTLTSGTFAHPQFGTVYEVSSYSKLVGDCKIFNGPGGTGNGGFVLVDTLGCELINIHMTTTAFSLTGHFSCSGL